MRNLNRLTNAASTIQARHDYAWLLNLAAEYGLDALIPPAGARPNHRAFDRAARGGIAQLLAAKPELKDKIAAVYPDYAAENEEDDPLVKCRICRASRPISQVNANGECPPCVRETARMEKPQGKCVTLEDHNGVEWKL